MLYKLTILQHRVAYYVSMLHTVSYVSIELLLMCCTIVVVTQDASVNTLNI